MEELRNDAAEMTQWQRHRFFALIMGVIAVSFILVLIALSLYNSSGAAQVDLSRPGYQSIQKEASRGAIDDSFPSNGVLDEKAFNDFDKLYGAHAKRVVGVDSFDPQALETKSLQLLDSPETATQQ